MRSTQDPGIRGYIEEWGLATEQELKYLDKGPKQKWTLL